MSPRLSCEPSIRCGCRGGIRVGERDALSLGPSSGSSRLGVWLCMLISGDSAVWNTSSACIEDSFDIVAPGEGP